MTKNSKTVRDGVFEGRRDSQDGFKGAEGLFWWRIVKVVYMIIKMNAVLSSN